MLVMLRLISVPAVQQFIWVLPKSTTSKSDASWHGMIAWGVLSLNINQLVCGKMLIISPGVKQERRYTCETGSRQTLYLS